jgi:hypothetical protein
MSGPGKGKLGGKGNDPDRQKESDTENAAWIQAIHDSDGKALIPPKGYQGKWEVGEYQQWLRIDTAPGQALTWVLYARRHGDQEPTFTRLPGESKISVTAGGQTDEILLGTSPAAGVAGQVVVRQAGKETVVLGPVALPALGQVTAEIPAYGTTQNTGAGTPPQP